MYQHVEQLLAGKAPVAVDEEYVSQSKRIVRKITLMPVRQTRSSIVLWKHTRTIMRIDSETYEGEELKSTRTRYAVSSLKADALPPSQWLHLHLCRWDVESAHQVLDVTFEEDDRPWITKNAQGNLAVHLLRRVAYTLMALYKYVTVRNDDESLLPWRKYLEWVKDALKWGTEEATANLRPRRFAIPPAFA